MARTLKQVREGDRVWISDRYHGDKAAIKAVKRLTPTQIVRDGAHEKYNRYQRGKSSRYGDELTYYGIGAASGSITGLATQNECEAWDAEQANKKHAQEEAQRRRLDDESKCESLQSLMPAKARVSGPYRNNWGERNVTIYASEDEVREIATRLAGILAAP